MPKGIYQHRPLAEEHKRNIGIGNKGKHISPETREKMSSSHKGKGCPRMIGNTYCKDRIPWNKGKKWLELSGEKHPMFGKHHSPETLKRLSEVNKQRYASGEKFGFQKGNKLTLGIKHSKEAREKRSGKNAYQWNGGSSFEPYPATFNRIFKELIRQRDGFLCLKCGMREEDSLILLKRKLTTHHIDYIKENTYKENCCALCIRCNAEVNVNRKQWIQFFQSILSERYGYNYIKIEVANDL